MKSFLKKYGKDLDVDKEANRLGRMFKEMAAGIIDDYNLPLTVDEYCLEIMPYYREKYVIQSPSCVLPTVKLLTFFYFSGYYFKNVSELVSI